ncbi:uncharacterized protein LOC130430197 [Triplophysa dalaica]|uniref:uncharacterized protein LOC130430197 n=1 Tax=Triplophysa dalaica TaxID=1582913 RepID=UPI0024E02B64|nr:uncharacterized protein LOC130430197 [Triplophysa dalaica]
MTCTFYSKVMNSYLLILVRRYNETHREEALSIDSFEMSQIWKNEKTKLKIDPMRFNIILGIINQHHHWMLMIIFPKQQRAILLDPFKATPLKLRRCLQSTRTFMKGRGCAVGKWTCETLPRPVQKDSVSCGVFSLKFAEKVLCNEMADQIEFPSSKEDLDEYRKEIARTVLEETDDLSEMCLYCGLQDGTKPKRVRPINMTPPSTGYNANIAAGGSIRNVLGMRRTSFAQHALTLTCRCSIKTICFYKIF